jgi:hypothetical protein
MFINAKESENHIGSIWELDIFMKACTLGQ